MGSKEVICLISQLRGATSVWLHFEELKGDTREGLLIFLLRLSKMKCTKNLIGKIIVMTA